MKALTSMMPSKMSFFSKLLELIVPANSTAKNLNSIFIVMDHIDTDLSQNMLSIEYSSSLQFGPN